MGTVRFSLLRILADGQVHSGERIGRSLGLSDLEVDQLVTGAESLGVHVLRAGSGYRLEEPIDLYDATLLAETVKRDFPVLRLEMLDECPSTNSALVERARAGAAHGTVLVCEHQGAGRGRRGNTWVSTVGGSVTFSVLWRFSRRTEELAGLSLAVAVGAAKGLEGLGLRGIAVKWPNDLFRGEGKLGGILIESTGGTEGPIAAVIGIGINMRLSSAARGRIGRPAADIAASIPAVPSRTVVLAGVLSSVASSLELFSREGFAPFRQAWLERHAWQGRRVVLLRADHPVAEGKVVGIAEDGALELASDRGIQRFYNGELSLSLG
jgi:BirA family transcriptional regulator, biotin operon repressor / biotin---[acetyl-CoA-carboxylase] ligase